MTLRPICEPVELPPGASVIAERVRIAADAPQLDRFSHFHDVPELVLFRRVRGTFFADGRRHRLTDGSIVFVPSMRQHDFALEGGAMEWVLVQLDPYIVEALAMRMPRLAQPFCAAPDERARKRIDTLADWLLETPGPTVERVVELLLLAVAEAPTSEPSPHSEAPARVERLLPALERLRTAPAEPLPLEEAATLCRLSPAYFSRRFRQLFGMPFTDYARIYRLHLAARRLVDGGAAISEIAYGVGFSSPAHFTARFRERFGMTPREYRASAVRVPPREGRGKRMNRPEVVAKPRQSLAGLMNISFGFLGIQVGFALQSANMSRIFQSLGASLDDLPALWIAAPLTGLLIQPIVGHLSDRTWLGRLGRRRPYFLAGAILAALSLFLMPESRVLLMSAVLLWALDASLNITMEPFRAFVGDMLRKDQHTAGYAVQTAFIGAGAVLGSLIPPALDRWGMANVAAGGGIPDTVRYAFWIGGGALLIAVLWTVLTTREYSPEQMLQFGETAEHPESDEQLQALARRTFLSPLLWIGAGALVLGAVLEWHLEKELYVLAGLLIAYGLASTVAILLARSGHTTNILTHIVGDFSGMPDVMKRLAVAQFFSWSALFTMWIYTTPVVAQNFYGSSDASSAAYQDAGNWVGVLFAVQNGVAAVAALSLLPWLAGQIGKARTHVFCLLCGAAGYASFLVLRDPKALFISEILIGIAWASILAMPYAILASSLPQKKLGIYMGLFNVFIVVPQLLVATVMGSIMKALFPDQPIWTMLAAAIVMSLAALAMLRVRTAD
jgi:maltose/moltooligosaccharide transporter